MTLILFTLLTCVAAYMVFKDAAQRGMNAKGWCLFIALTSLLGLPLYLLARRAKRPI